MSDKHLHAKSKEILALADKTEQEALRKVALFVLEAEGVPGAKQVGQQAIIRAAKAFTTLLSRTFQAVAWNPEGLYDEESFRQVFERVREATDNFKNVAGETLRGLLERYPQALLVLRCIAALSLDEICFLLKEEERESNLAKDVLRDLELGRDIGDTNRMRWRDGLGEVINILSQAISGQLLELPSTAEKTLFKDRKDKIDTRHGWKSVRETAERGVPYWGLLYQRYVGGFFRQAMDASSSIKGDILELALERLFKENNIPFYRTRPREKIAGWEQAPDFLLPNRTNPKIAIEAKLAEDGGTARDKAARIERFCKEARSKGIFPVAVIDGKGFYRINDVTAPVLRNTRGETFTLQTLSRILGIPMVSRLKKTTRQGSKKN